MNKYITLFIRKKVLDFLDKEKERRKLKGYGRLINDIIEEYIELKELLRK